MAPELSKGKTLVVLAIVIGCFAILWPKIFYPMFQGSVAPTPQHQPAVKERDPAGALCCGVVFESDASSTAFLAELCNQVLKQRDQIPPDRILPLCHAELLNKCGIDLEDVVKSDVDGAVVDRRLRSKFHGRVRAHNLTSCLEVNFGIDENLVRAKKSYHRPTDVFYPRHMRPERPPHLHPDMMNQHPALREKGRVIPPTRTIEKQAKPGPMPGMRPPMGGAGHIVSPSPGSGGMGVLMPIYTIGIIVFFLYTMMKIMFKKPQEDVVEPRIKDFHMDAEHRKYLFAEEYCTGVPGAVPEMTVKEYALLQEQQKALLLQQQRKSRSKTPEVSAKKDEELEPLIEEHLCKNEALVEAAQPAEESELEEEEIIPRSPKMDTDGKPIEEEEVDQLKRRLEETERAMERICRQMGNVTDKLSTSAVAEMLTPHLTDNKEAEEESVPADAAKTQPVEDDVINEVVQDTSPVEEDVKCQSIPVSQLEEIVENKEECQQEIPVPQTTESADLPKVNEIRLEDVESQIVAAVVSSVESAPEQEEESQRQIDETIEEMMKSGQEPAQEESHIDQMIEEMMKSDVEPEEPVESVQEEEVPVKEIQSSIEEIPEKTVEAAEETQVPELVQEETLVQVIAEEDQTESKSEILQEPTSESVQEQSAVLEEQVPTKEEELETEVVSAQESVSLQNVEESQVEIAVEEDVSQVSTKEQVLEPETAQETMNVQEKPVPEELAQEEIPSKAEEEIQPELETSSTNMEELVSTPTVETTESESVQDEVSIKQVQQELETEPVQEPIAVETTEVSVESVQESQDQVPVKELETDETVQEQIILETQMSDEVVQESQVQDEVPVKELETETVQEQIIVETNEETQVTEEAVQEPITVETTEVSVESVQESQDQVHVKELETETVQEQIIVETQVSDESVHESQVQDEVSTKELESESVQEDIVVETTEETQVSDEPVQESQVQDEISTKEPETETIQEDIVVETQVSEEAAQESQVQEEVSKKELESETVEEQIIAETTEVSVESVQESQVQDEAPTKEDQQDAETIQEPISVEEITEPEPVKEVEVPAKEEEIVEEPISSVEKVATELEQTPVEEHVPAQEEDQIQSSVEETLQSQPETVPEPVNQEEETLVETTKENEPETVQEQTIVQEHVPVKEEESQSSIEESLVSETVQENTEEDESLQSVETIEEILETDSTQEQTIAEDNQPSLPDETSAEEIEEREQVHPQVEQSSVVRHGSEERKMTVNVCSMDVTTSMADHGKMPTDLLPKITHHPHRSEESAEIPSVFLDTSIPPESHLVVTEAECSAQVVPAEDLDLDANEYESSPVVLSGKMTLSVIGMELSADAPELQIEPKVEEPDAPRVRFPPQPTDRIFLIPVEPEEELIPEDPNDTHLQDRVEDEDEMVDDSAVIYRPPTPPLQHLNEQDAEFLTYDQLEEVGEADVIIPEVPQVKRLDSIPDADEEEVEEFWSKDSGVDQTLLDSVESHIISTEEAEALNEKNVPVVSEHIEQVETVPAVHDEHVSIGEMAEKIRVAMEESVRETNLPVAQEPEVVEQQSAIVEEDLPVEEDTTTLNEEEINIPSSIQSALSEMVDNIISASIAGSVVEALRREECDNETVIVAQVSEPDCLEQSVGHQLAERINLLSDSGTDSVLMDVEYQLIPSSDSVTGTDNGEQDHQVEEDFERNSEVTEMEHALEQIEKQVEPSEEELPTVVTEAEEEEPSISGFIIREDFPEDEETEPMTEEEILQARQEIEEIKKLLADVSSGVVHQTGQESSNIVSELAYAMAEDAAVAAATSKGSSPDMDEYEVIQTARPTETSEDGEKTRSTNTTVTSTTNDS